MKVIALKTHVSSHGRHLVGDAYDEDKEWAKDKIKRRLCAKPDSKEGKAAAKIAKARERQEEKRRAAAERHAKKAAKKKAAPAPEEGEGGGDVSDGPDADNSDPAGDGEDTNTDDNETAATDEAAPAETGDTPLNV